MGDLFPMFWFWFSNCLRLPKLQERCELMGFRPQGNPKDSIGFTRKLPVSEQYMRVALYLELCNGHEQNVFSTTRLGGRTF